MSEIFRIDTNAYAEELEKVWTETQRQQKGRHLENLARRLFEGMPFLKCKHLNLNTSSSELDMVVQYDGWNKRTIFDEFGRYFLVESKNWDKRVGARHVRDFVSKIEKCRVRLGVLISPKGVSGARDGNNAIREIRWVFDKEGLCVAVISDEDLEKVKLGKNFCEILEYRMESIMFDAFIKDEDSD